MRSLVFGRMRHSDTESAHCAVALFTSLFHSLRLSFQRVRQNFQVIRQRLDIDVEV
jgi:hypothetical protein